MAIRKASKQDRNSKILKFNPTTKEDIEVYTNLRQHATWLMELKYEGINPELRSHLLEAVLLRQKRFLYRKSQGAVPKPKLARAPSPAPGNIALRSTPHVPNSQARKSTNDKSVAHTQKTANTASAFDERAFKPKAPPSKGSAMSVTSLRQDKELEWPAPPRKSNPEIECECPYCFDFLTDDEIVDTKAWRFVKFVNSSGGALC